MDGPLVSIVTPCYNGENYLGRFLRSVLNQTYINIELILVNDGSDDNTESIVSYYQNIMEAKGIRFIYLYQKNAGQAAALNRGLKLVSGEYLTWLDSDDEIMPDFIEKKVVFFDKHPKCVYCYGKAICVMEDSPEKIIHTYEKRKKNGNKDFFEDIIFVRNVFFSGYFVKTSAIDTVIPNREIYTGVGGQNAQLLLPLAWYFGEPGYVEESVYKYYIRMNSHSHRQNTSERVIQQLYNYEQILISTMNRIPDCEVKKYIVITQKHYAKLRFGNAVDTKDSDLIKKYYREMRQMKAGTIFDFLLYIKYSNSIVRKICRIG